MSIRSWTSRACTSASLCALALLGHPHSAHADVQVALTPFAQSIAPGSDFDVFIDITGAGSAFNGFNIVVSYDPAALTLLPAAPSSAQQGCLMTGGCSAACGSTFHQFSVASDSIRVSDLLLCNLTSIVGPGNLYHLRFHASNTPQVSYLSIRRCNFFDGGVLVGPVRTTGCVVAIGTSLGVGDEHVSVTRPMRVEPNPAFGRVHLVSDDDAGGLVQADILDVQGRVVRQLGPAWLGPRARLDWDGADHTGARAPAGLYLVRIQRQGRTQNSRFILLP